ncbi:phosphatase PAP2 family protein [Amnibacterium kyonggiense]|uniref:Undecaprenyl-diphosphatase n=1 Tax=Amnibacterium kyonggiense TaxID=595671 RepID=A0A4R7FP23_9MICO|nr:phosphatase PAP2 family protein [Amnibacterium kyonggiense]TDS79481.1 undecaprenyl-diphosphatase [Amnibacterium kyonggiense]
MLGAAVALAGVWGLAALIRVTHAQPGAVDRWWDALMTAVDGPTAHAVAAALGVVGTGLPASALAVAVGVLIGAVRGWAWGVFVPAASIVGELDVSGMKALALRARPDAAFGVLNAFPSGHTANAALLGTAVVLLIRHLVVRSAAIAWIVAMAWSRTELHAHWLTDVLAAIAVGAATAILLVAACLAVGMAVDRSGRAGGPRR